MKKILLNILISSFLISFIGSVHSETDRDKKERLKTESLSSIERSRTFIGKEYWFDLKGDYCFRHVVLKPQSSVWNHVEGEPTKGTILDVVGDGSIEGEKFTDSDYTFLKIKLSDDRIVYMGINHFMFEIDMLKINSESDSDSMMCVYPEEPVVFWKKVKEERFEQQRKEKEKEKEKQKKQSSKQGVRLGMTTKEVIEKTSWGKPKSVNKTTNQNGVHEQWVYGDGNYLYFDNGKLTSIQN